MSRDLDYKSFVRKLTRPGSGRLLLRRRRVSEAQERKIIIVQRNAASFHIQAGNTVQSLFRHFSRIINS